MKWWLAFPLLTLLILPVHGQIGKVERGFVVDITYTSSEIQDPELHSIEVVQVEDDVILANYYDQRYPHGSVRDIRVSLNVFGGWFVHPDFDNWAQKLDNSSESLIFISNYGWNQSLLNYEYVNDDETGNFLLVANYTQVTEGVEEYFEYHIMMYDQNQGVLVYWEKIIVDAFTEEEAREEWKMIDTYHTSNLLSAPIFVPPVIFGLAVLRRRHK